MLSSPLPPFCSVPNVVVGPLILLIEWCSFVLFSVVVMEWRVWRQASNNALTLMHVCLCVTLVETIQCYQRGTSYDMEECVVVVVHHCVCLFWNVVVWWDLSSTLTT